MLPAHWQRAAKRLGLDLRTEPETTRIKVLVRLERPTKSWGTTITHRLVRIEVESHRKNTWAATSMFSDLLDAEYVLPRLGLSPDREGVQGLGESFITLSSVPIPKKEFRVRYPEVQYARAHDFVLLHELGHALRGWREAAADEYAFARLLMPQDPKAKAMRDLWYEQMPPPMPGLG